MTTNTAIEWTNHTWNPWMGCSKVSPGCAHCYMFTEQRRYGHDPEVVRRSKTTFRAPLRFPVTPAYVFTCSWSDWFHEAADDWRPEAWEIIRQTPHLTYQILTKRPERIAEHLPADWGAGWPNVWLGTSIENRRFTQRAALLLRSPAVLHFVSAEPLLGPVDLREWLGGTRVEREFGSHGPVVLRKPEGIDWVIAGGESGPGPRRCEADWIRSLRDQCTASHVPFFLKQLGGFPDKRGHDKAVLDGQLWRAMPEVAA